MSRSFPARIRYLRIIPSVTCHACTTCVYRTNPSGNRCICTGIVNRLARTMQLNIDDGHTLNRAAGPQASLHVQKAWRPPCCFSSTLKSEHMLAITTPHPCMHRSVTGNTMPPSGTEEVQKRWCSIYTQLLIDRAEVAAVPFFFLHWEAAVWPAWTIEIAFGVWQDLSIDLGNKVNKGRRSRCAPRPAVPANNPRSSARTIISSCAGA